MLSCFDFLRDINALSVGIRLFLAMLCGGAVGLERSYRRRPVGFRTHILICLGAAMTTMTSQYLLLVPRLYNDISRMGAQVVAGISFIGAGCIIVTRRRRVKGLTTAAGLWVVAIVGLACGAGYVEGAILTTALVLLAEVFFSKLEYRLVGNALDANFYVEYQNTAVLNEIMKYVHDLDLKVLDLEIQKGPAQNGGEEFHPCANLTIQFHRKFRPMELLQELEKLEGVFAVHIL